ncbi:MAG: hypothetical protein HOC47_04725 [Candidatus Marinimicrobia bacterium]|nr:hypothetical protein [Candidatus Neomarinimicrobiota bacterium]MBT3829227.1 hypothetical protein [Candidatus Neomarinimicrobiota bacterium]MBT3996779.1 hypothetical protein [Candidatus Neomarinimicrobiota bacterium]MBT4569845.1 hypothetical protein [Candidatus Neomarinimicrobiota bacterium]MBT5339810.1 hypothetical protein [Candidatus Neomarinimicrobiota bacterium]
MNNPAIIGIDGGATKVSASRIKQSSAGFTLGRDQSQKIYSDFPGFDPGFTPVNIDSQLKEMYSGIILTDAEQIQEKAIIGTFVETISEINIGEQIIIGIGMPGLKTVDVRGIAAMANGPRMPHFCDNLEQILSQKGLQLAKPIHHLGSDADYCGLGEEFAADGLFKAVTNGYYLGGGTGTADALKLKGKLVPFDDTKAWLLKSWEMMNQDQIEMEQFASTGGIQSIYSTYSGISIESLNADGINADVILKRAIQKEEPALKTFADVSFNLADLLFERIETIYSGWEGRYGFVDPNRGTPSSKHPYLGIILDRIIIGQRLGALLESSKGYGILWEPLIHQLRNLIKKSDRLHTDAKAVYLDNLQINPELVKISTLRKAPIIGAGIDAAQT